MRFLRFTSALLTIVLGEAFCSAAVIASPPAEKMAALQYLLGDPWTCVSHVPAMGALRPQTVRAHVKFEAFDDGVLHDHISAPPFQGDQYFGYDGTSGKWWITGDNNQGGTMFQTSTDGRVYSGWISGLRPLDVSDTYIRISDTHFTIHEVDGNASRTVTVDTACTR